MCLLFTPSRSSDGQVKKKPVKVMRKWDVEAPSESEMAALDFSAHEVNDIKREVTSSGLIDTNSMGKRGKDGTYEIQDWEFNSDANDAIAQAIEKGSSTSSKQQNSSTTLGAMGSLFARFTGGKTLTEEDLQPVLATMKEHLMKKNVAKGIADKVCDGVGKEMLGKKISGYQCPFTTSKTPHSTYILRLAVKTAVKEALSNTIAQILTPKMSTDILQAIRAKLSSPLPSTAKRSPYIMTFVGVNGVGKSTNLSKVCFWLLQNGFRVLIAACDTFR
jgi:signal recognition particle receptor subunit alpha